MLVKTFQVFLWKLEYMDSFNYENAVACLIIELCYNIFLLLLLFLDFYSEIGIWVSLILRIL